MARRGETASNKTYFYPTEDVAAILDGIRARNEYGGLTRFINEVIRRHAEAERALIAPPPIRFVDPSPEYFDMADFLRHSREVVMLGLTLSSVHRRDIFDLFVHKITEQRTPFTFMLIDRHLAGTTGIHRVLAERYRHHEHSRGDFLAHLDRTYARLRELVGVGRDHRVPVRVRCLTSIPFCGLTISDPDRDTCRLRVALYLESRAGDTPPFLELASSTEAGRTAMNAFMRHYRSLLQDASLDIVSPESIPGGDAAPD